MTQGLEQLAKEIATLAQAAAAGERVALESFERAVTELTSLPPSRLFPTPADVLFDGFAALLQAPALERAALAILAPPLLDAVATHPQRGLPWDFAPQRQLGDDAIPLLARLLDRGMAQASRATIEAYGKGSPMNDGGFQVTVQVLERLFAYEGSEAAVAAALCGLPWDDDRLWLLFRVLSGRFIGPYREVKDLGPVAACALPALVKATATIHGDGSKRFRAVLLKAKLISKADAGGAKAAKLPRKLPTEIDAALSLLSAFALTPEAIRAGPPASVADLQSLTDTLSFPLPAELRSLLERHESIGERELGPPRRIEAHLASLTKTVADHETEGEPSLGAGEYDIRAFEDLIPLGTDDGGDLFLLATGARSAAGTVPVIRLHHDEALVTTVAADSLGEYVALLFARAFARREGLETAFSRLEKRRRKITLGAGRVG